MANLVIDASLATAWCFPDEHSNFTNGVLHALSGPLQAFVPRLWVYEVHNSVLMGCRRGRISKVDASRFLVSLDDLNIHVTDPVSYVHLVRLAERHSLTVYDAAYLDLAMREGSQLATLDDALSEAALAEDLVLFKLPK